MRITASKLNVRSGPGTDFRVLGQLAQGATVDGLESHGEWLWVSGAAGPEGWVHGAYVARSHLSVPEGHSGIVSAFGPPGSPRASAGRARLPRPLKLSWSAASITRFACHVELEDLLSEVFAEIERRGFWRHLRNFGGCYNLRTIGRSGKYSTHSWGIAVDLNTDTNAQGTQGDMAPELVATFRDFGFTWGGEWSGASRDPMHFQYARGY